MPMALTQAMILIGLLLMGLTPAKQHDMNYVKDASTNYWGYVDDMRTLNADKIMIKAVKNFWAQMQIWHFETKIAASGQLGFIGYWRVQGMESW